MRDINHYIDAARDRTGCKSDRKLALLIGLAGTTINHWRTGRSLPDDETMAKLAQLAGQEPTMALLDLNIWRSKDGLARSHYIDLARRIGRSAAAFFCVGFLGAAAAALTPPQTQAAVAQSLPRAIGTQAAQGNSAVLSNVYYGKSRRRAKRRIGLDISSWAHNLIARVKTVFMFPNPQCAPVA